MPNEWWRGATLYEIYVRSFQDSNGDGIGDLAGITARLNYLEWLGVDGIWLTPTFPSPNADWGYDVTDYYGVHPELGTLDDLDELVAEAGKRGIRVLLDFVAGHTSNEHPWFLDSRASTDSPRRDWYVWEPGDVPPNDWRAGSSAPAWTPDPATGEQYLHTFLAQQPDLNWWSDEVRDEFDGILEFWFERGIAGFRIDAAPHVVRARDLEAPGWGTWERPPPDPEEIHEVLRRWRRVADRYDERLLIGQTWIEDASRLGDFVGSGDELHLALSFPILDAPFYAYTLSKAVVKVEAALPERACPAWQVSTHDSVRFPTRWGAGDERRTRAALLLLLGLRGTIVLYYGDEIGMAQASVPASRALDHWARDGCRTPMQWSAAPGAGFTGETEPWLPVGDLRRNVVAQRDDPGSMLSLCRDLIALRRELPELALGAYERLDAPKGVWACRRGEEVTVVANLSGMDVSLAGFEGTIRVATDRARDGQRVQGALQLSPWEGAVLVA